MIKMTDNLEELMQYQVKGVIINEFDPKDLTKLGIKNPHAEYHEYELQLVDILEQRQSALENLNFQGNWEEDEERFFFYSDNHEGVTAIRQVFPEFEIQTFNPDDYNMD